MFALWTRRAVVSSHGVRRAAMHSPLTRAIGTSSLRFSEDKSANASAPSTDSANASPAPAAATAAASDAKPVDPATAAAAESDAKVAADAEAKAKADAEALAKAERKARFRGVNEFLSGAEELSPSRYESDDVVADSASDIPTHTTSGEADERPRAALLHRLYNTPVARALRPEQSESLKQLHMMRVLNLRNAMVAHKQKEKRKAKYGQRPVRIAFGPTNGSKAAEAFDSKKDAWIGDYLKSMKHDLEHSQSPWPVGKREEFLKTANRVLHRKFNAKALAAFAHNRPLPPPHRRYTLADVPANPSGGSTNPADV